MVNLRGSKMLLIFFVVCWPVMIGAMGKVPLHVEVTDMNGMVISEVVLDDQFMVKILIDDANIVQGEPHLVTNDTVVANRVRVSYKQINKNTSYEYIYVARALQVGIAEIGPITIDTKQGLYQSSVIKVAVVGTDKDRTQSKSTQTSDVWITLAVDKEQVMVGQEINATLSLYAAQEPHSITNLDIPVINGLTRVGAAVSKEERKVIEGKTYYVLQTKWRWVAEQEGPIMVPAVMLSCTMAVKSHGWFALWQLETKQLHSNRLHLTIHPLPPYTGHHEFIGVGRGMEIRAFVDKHHIPLKDALVYTIELSGSNGVEHIQQMHIKNIDKEWKIYPSKISTIEGKGDHFVDNALIKKFEYVLQSMKPGDIVIPSQTYSYFDLIDSEYKIIKTDEIAVHVAGAIAQSTLPVVQGSLVIPQEEVLSSSDESNVSVMQPCNEHGAWYAKRSFWVFSWQLFFILFFLPLLFMTIVGGYSFLYRYWVANATERYYRNAFSIAHNEWRVIRSRGDRPDLYQLFIRLFAHRYKVYISQVSHEQIIDWLRERKMSNELIVDFDAFLSYLAACMYGGGVQHTRNTDIFLQAEKWIKQLEKVL